MKIEPQQPSIKKLDLNLIFSTKNIHKGCKNILRRPSIYELTDKQRTEFFGAINKLNAKNIKNICNITVFVA